METTRRRFRGLAWRACEAWSSVAGAAVASVLAATAGEVAIPVFFAWFGVGALLLTRPAERLGVRVRFGYRLAPPETAAMVEDVARRVGAGDVDVYLSPAAGLNAYATGRRSIALTQGLLGCRQMSSAGLEAIVAHELGHLLLRHHRYALASQWWAAPWRSLRGAVRGIVRVASRRLPLGRASMALVPIVTGVAVVRLVEQRAWISVGCFVALAIDLLVIPKLEASLGRQGEHDADAVAASAGMGPALEAALDVTSPGSDVGHGSSHPSSTERGKRLTAVG